ncbi:SMI1/KNR4 family protein [Streptomonospora arabica]|uniref:SMI1/KNR4 family protein n=1 Tax=Streptomonospora arabica TaxID=412417 RepID=A0ABV9SI08_9ACTN
MDDDAEVLAFTTERRRLGSRMWEGHRRIAVLLDTGANAPLSRLHWRDRDGAETDIGFDPGATGFSGLRTEGDGTAFALRGRRSEQPPARTPHLFRQAGGEEGELRLLVEDGGAPAARVGWTDADGGGGAVVLRSAAEVGGDLTGRIRGVAVSGEHSAAGEVGENLLDDTAAKWLAFKSRGAWVLFTMAEPVAVHHYVLGSADDCPGRDPRAWALKGSLDARTWTVLDTRSDEFFPDRHQERGFDVTGSAVGAAFRYLLLEIRGNRGDPATQLNRVRLHAASPAYESFSGYRQEPGAAPRTYEGTAVGVGTGPAGEQPLITAQRWRAYLAEYSADMLRVEEEDELGGVTDEQRAAGWLGYEGAPEERIADLEERLGTRLPPSYRSFLAASDGWRDVSAFMYELLSTDAVDWADDDDFGLFSGADDEPEPSGLQGPVLRVSGEGDAQYWLLDAGDVGPDGEWAAYIWASWYPGLGERHRSFADLVAAERAAFEKLKGSDGLPVRPDGADELLAEGRRAALRGDVDEALKAFESAETKGSGAAAYLKAVLSAFLGEFRFAHHALRNTLCHAHVVEAVGAEQLGAEAVPLFLAAAGRAGSASAAPLSAAVRSLGGDLPPGMLPDESEAAGLDTDAWISARRTPESPAFERALESARALAADGAHDEAWSAIRRALPEWYPVAENRIAPVVLLTDPALRGLVTPRRAREAVCTPRGGYSAPGR